MRRVPARDPVHFYVRISYRERWQRVLKNTERQTSKSQAHFIYWVNRASDPRVKYVRSVLYSYMMIERRNRIESRTREEK